MSIILQQRDKNILKHIEKYGFITIHQAAQIFFKSNRMENSYTYARLRLSKLYKAGIITKSQIAETKENVYLFAGEKTPTLHKNLLMNVYSNLIYHDCKIHYFKPSQEFVVGKSKIIADGFCIFFNPYTQSNKALIIEVDINHHTKNKYDKLYETNQLQEQLGDFPMVLIVNANGDGKDNEYYTTIYIDFDLTNFKDKVLAI